MFNNYDKRKRKWFMLTIFLFLSGLTQAVHAAVNDFDKIVDHPPIPVLDEQGNHVLESGNPYSPKMTCAGSGCHDYDEMTKAYHFQQGRDESSDDYGAKRGLPQLVSPGYYGGYNCMTGNTPDVLAKKDNPDPVKDFADKGSAHFVQSCESCHIGGGWSEYDRDGVRYDQKDMSKVKPYDGDYYVRNVNHATGEETYDLWDWKKSGVVEADCLYCHVDFDTLKMPEDSGLDAPLAPRRARSAMASLGFFRQVASGFMEYVVNNEGKNILTIAREMGSDGHGGEAPVLSKDANGLPIFNWHQDSFDENGRVTIPMLRFPKSENCMSCHLTANSRRGFYGFGDESKMETDADGILLPDGADDVHKGTVYIADNGEARSIENCNACHSKQYYKSKLANIDLDANHDFLKGNSDIDVRNDLNYTPGMMTCEKCHINSVNNVIPSGHGTLLDAHRELWKSNGDMLGYTADTLNQITQTHFDVVSCQACHIKDKTYRGNPMKMLYRYREAEDGKLKIMPYFSKPRTYWIDRKSNRTLYRNELNGVFEQGTDADGNPFGAIVDPISGEQLGKVSASVGRHGLRYGEPESYEDYKGLKQAYDSLLVKKGFENPSVTRVLSEINHYTTSHNTRTSPESVQCEECHERKQSGAFSALVSPKGILGDANFSVLYTLPDSRLIDEGVATLGMPYMRKQANGDVTVNVTNILFSTKYDPFMSALKNSSASEVLGVFQELPSSVFSNLGIPAVDSAFAQSLTGVTSFMFNVSATGDTGLRNMVAVINGSTVNDILFPTYRGALGVLKGANEVAQGVLSQRGLGQLRSDVFYIDVTDSAKNRVESFKNEPLFLTAVYTGDKTDASGISVVMANWELDTITVIPQEDIVYVSPANDAESGIVLFKTKETGYFIVGDK